MVYLCDFRVRNSYRNTSFIFALQPSFSSTFVDQFLGSIIFTTQLLVAMLYLSVSGACIPCT